jgi:hypothetical protein
MKISLAIPILSVLLAAPARAAAPTPPPGDDDETPAAAATAATPAADEPSKVVAGVRVGFEATSGDVVVNGGGPSSSTTVHYTAHQKIPLTIDVGGRLSPHVTLGGYLRLAAVMGGETDVSWSVGVALGVFTAPQAKASPWLGLGVGYQSLGADAPFTGLELVPQLALPIRVGPHLVVGPHLEVSIVDYSASSSVCSSCSGWNVWGGGGLRVGWL